MTDVRLTATNPEDSSVVPVACNAKGELKLEEVPTFDGNLQGNLTVSGQLSASVSPSNAAEPGLIVLGPEQGQNSGSVYIGGVTSRKIELNALDGNATFNGSASFGSINSNGSVTFAGNKAGFTAAGHLWCTTERGETVKLAATVGGAGLWEDYTPPGRWSEKDVIRPVPEESSQDEPETPQ